MTSPLTAGGLLLDIAGAVALAMSFMTKKEKEALQEAGTYAGQNPFLFLSLAKQKADAWVGAALLIMGFLAQFVANVIDDEPDWLSLCRALAAGAMLATLGGVLLRYGVRPYFVGRAVEAALVSSWRDYQREDYYAEKPGEAERHWWWGVEGWGYRLGKPRRDGEDLQVYGRRMLGQRCWNRVGADKPPPPDDYESRPVEGD